jgi:uncharacterized protein (TIGR02466 family)
MPIEAWFPTPIFYEDVAVPDAAHESAMAAIASVVDAEKVAGPIRVTAYDAPNSLHLDARMAPLLECLVVPLRRFLFDGLHFDPATTQFHIGRCWPVLQTAGGEGGLHTHGGAIVSGVFYLETPPGSGGIEFRKPLQNVLDHIAKKDVVPLTFQSTIYAAIRHRVLLFPSDLRHRGLANEPGTSGVRVAIAFDVYATSDLAVPDGGMPHAQFLVRV